MTPPDVGDFRADVGFAPALESILCSILQRNRQSPEDSAWRVAERLREVVRAFDGFVSNRLSEVNDAIDNEQFELAGTLMADLGTVVLPGPLPQAENRLRECEREAEKTRLLEGALTALNVGLFEEAVAVIRQLR